MPHTFLCIALIVPVCGSLNKHALILQRFDLGSLPFLDNTLGMDVFAFYVCLDGDAGENDSSTEPLTASEFVFVHDHGKEHRE